MNNLFYEFIIKNLFVSFPGGPVVKNLPASAGVTGSIPDPGRSHMLERLSPAPQLLKPVLHNERSHHSEKPEHRN